MSDDIAKRKAEKAREALVVYKECLYIYDYDIELIRNVQATINDISNFLDTIDHYRWRGVSEKLPSRGDTVEFITVFNDDIIKGVYQGVVSDLHKGKGYYSGFGCVEINAVKFWRYQ